MRLDHIAYRVSDRHKTVKFFCDALGYKIATEFEPKFNDGSVVKCFALVPPEKVTNTIHTCFVPMDSQSDIHVEYHVPPEIFVSEGDKDSIVGRWVAERGGVGGIHHLAYQVTSVVDTMKEWREKGWAEFTTDEPLTCPDLVQCFTKPSELTGVIFEFIERKKHGFCVENVSALMESTK